MLSFPFHGYSVLFTAQEEAKKKKADWKLMFCYFLYF